jgi:CHU_C Type IX secretion signal domain
VTVFNRWGDEVFSAVNYDNVEKVFNGMNNSGGELPAGNYDYKIAFTSRLKTKTGYVVLKR